MKYKAVIFDMDGLILDTEIIESRSFEKLLNEYGIKAELYENGLLHKIGGAVEAKTYYENFKKQYNLPIDADIVRDKKRAYWQKMVEEEEIKAFPGFIELIALLQENKLIIALASNRNETFLHLVLEKLKVKHHFRTIVGPAEGRRGKPYPDIYLHTAKEIGVKPEECIVLEDTDVGIISAKDAGMKAIAIPNIYTKDHNFARADIVVGSLREVTLELLKKL